MALYFVSSFSELRKVIGQISKITVLEYECKTAAHLNACVKLTVKCH